MLTTQFFGMKIQRYIHDHDLPVSLLAKVSAKAFRNGALNPNAWRRTPLSESDIAEAPMVSDPLTKYMFCSPGEGAVALVLASGKKAAALQSNQVMLRSVVQRTRRYGSFEVFSPWLAPERADSPTVEAAGACFEDAGIGPADVDVAQIQDTEAGAEIMHMSETGFCAAGEQEELIMLATQRSVDRCRSIPTADASPTGNRSARQGCGRSTRMWCSYAGRAARGRCPEILGGVQPRLRRAGIECMHVVDPVIGIATPTAVQPGRVDSIRKEQRHGRSPASAQRNSL